MFASLHLVVLGSLEAAMYVAQMYDKRKPKEVASGKLQLGRMTG